MDNTTNKIKVTASRDQEFLEPATGGRCSPQESKSTQATQSVEVLMQASTASNGAGTVTAGEGAEQALSGGRKATEATVGTVGGMEDSAQKVFAPVGNTTAEKVVPSSTQQNQAPDGVLTAYTEAGNRAAQTKVIDIGLLSEDELLSKLRGYINTMCAFAKSTRNVHKELKETLANSNKIMAQYVKVLRQGRNSASTSKANMPAHTQPQENVATEAPSNESVRDVCKTNSLIMDINQEVKAMRKELNDIRASQCHKKHDNEDGGASSWAEVTRKKPLVKNVERDLTSIGTVTVTWPKTKGKASARPKRKRPPAIIVRIKDGTYSEALKKLKGNGQVKTFSDDIVGLTKTRDGDLLVRTNPNSESRSELIQAISDAIGDSGAVKELVQYHKVVIQDLDEQAEPEEVIEAICKSTEAKPEDLRVAQTREAARGQKWVVVSLQPALATKVLSLGKLRVGYVNCRLRLWEDRGRGRCPRCLAFGHARDTCKGPDRTKCCRACGKTGHLAASCEANGTEKEAFQSILTQDQGEVRREPVPSDAGSHNAPK